MTTRLAWDRHGVLRVRRAAGLRIAALLLGLTARLGAGPPAPPARPFETITELELQGHVVCLAEALHARHDAELPAAHEHLWAFQAADGRYFTLLRGKYS